MPARLNPLQEQWRSEGLCRFCGAARVPGRTMCETHLAKQRARSRASADRARRGRTGARARSVPAKRLSREEQHAAQALNGLDVLLANERPRTRGDCEGGARPCPWVTCKHHLYLDVNPESGSIKLNFPDLEVWDMAETCSLDLADRDGITLEEVGSILNLTRERIRQVEVRGLLKLRLNGGSL